MDPFEEFEFKPLTEGLGFHKRQQKSQISPVSSMAGGNLEMLEDSPLNPPLPRQAKNLRIDNDPSDSSVAVDEILKTLRSKKITSEAEQKKPMSAPKAAPKYLATTPSLSAMFLDGLLILAGTLLCMIVLLSITKTDVSAILFSSQAGMWIYLSTVALFAAVTFIYQVVNRVFLGATPGEWAYDQRLGHPEDMNHATYTIGAVIRSTIVIMTGFFPLPLISIAMGKDIAGTMSGTQIFERV